MTKEHAGKQVKLGNAVQLDILVMMDLLDKLDLCKLSVLVEQPETVVVLGILARLDILGLMV